MTNLVFGNPDHIKIAKEGYLLGKLLGKDPTDAVPKKRNHYCNCPNCDENIDRCGNCDGWKFKSVKVGEESARIKRGDVYYRDFCLKCETEAF